MKDKIKEYEKLAKQYSGNFWDYRWIKQVDEWDAKDLDGHTRHYSEATYSLHEVYYDRNNKPFMFTDNPIRFIANKYDEVIETISKALGAAKKPVLLLKEDTLIETEEYMEGLE